MTPPCAVAEDIRRAGISAKWWIVNQSLSFTDTRSEFLNTQSFDDSQWIEKARKISNGSLAVIPWKPFDMKGERLLELL